MGKAEAGGHGSKDASESDGGLVGGEETLSLEANVSWSVDLEEVSSLSTGVCGDIAASEDRGGREANGFVGIVEALLFDTENGFALDDGGGGFAVDPNKFAPRSGFCCTGAFAFSCCSGFCSLEGSEVFSFRTSRIARILPDFLVHGFLRQLNM